MKAIKFSTHLLAQKFAHASRAFGIPVAINVDLVDTINCNVDQLALGKLVERDGFTLNSPFEPIRANLGRQVFEHLRDSIYTMKIEPGAHLGISETAEKLGVSRSPVRDAFLMLVSEGLVELSTPGSYRVIHFDRKYITDVYVIRRALELTAVRLCVENPERERLEKFCGTWERFKVADVSKPDFLEQHLTADNELHRGIAEMSQNALLKEALDKIISLAALIRRWQYGAGASHQQLIPSAEEHLKVLYAILTHDAERAVAALDEHLTLAHARSLARLDLNPGLLSDHPRRTDEK